MAVLEVKSIVRQEAVLEVVDCSRPHLVGYVMVVTGETGFIKRAKAAHKRQILVGAKIHVSMRPRHHVDRQGISTIEKIEIPPLKTE